MFDRILVPLDGSEFAEQALTFAVDLAHRERATLCLVHVDTSSRAASAQTYLERVADRVARQHAMPAERRVISEAGASVARVLAGEVDATSARCVVMTTHGRGGLERLWLGSVADQLIRLLQVPVFLLRAPPPAPIRRVLVPLDGTLSAERVLPFAHHFARLTHASLTLLHVVLLESELMVTPHGARWVELTMPRERAVEEAERYLESTARQLPPGVSVDAQVSVHESIPSAILEAAQGEDATLIALTTHARPGLERWLLGSVADKLVRSTTLPLLIMRP